ncbi:elongation factor 1-gamma-like [Pelodytes ibericus]
MAREKFSNSAEIVYFGLKFEIPCCEAPCTLFYSDCHWQAFPILITAKHSGLDLDLHCERTDVAARPPPNLKRPKYEEEDGVVMHGFECIMFYIASNDLQGTGLREKSLIQLWLRFVQKEIVPLLYIWIYPIMGLLPYHETSTENAKKTFKKVMSVLDSHLRTRTYMVGERMSVADITIASVLLWPYVLVLDPTFRKPYISMNRWFLTCINNRAFVEALGNVPLCDKVVQYRGLCALLCADLIPAVYNIRDRGSNASPQVQTQSATVLLCIETDTVHGLLYLSCDL